MIRQLAHTWLAPWPSRTPAIPHPHFTACRSKYEVLHLKVVHRRHCTGFEQERELALHIDDLIAGRYQVGGGGRLDVKGGSLLEAREGKGHHAPTLDSSRRRGGECPRLHLASRSSPPLSWPHIAQIVDLLGQAAFSRAVQALDLRTGALVCLKIIKVGGLPGLPSWVGRGWVTPRFLPHLDGCVAEPLLLQMDNRFFLVASTLAVRPCPFSPSSS